MSIKVTSDRMIDLTDDQLKEQNISTMSCYINMGDKSYNDLIDVFPNDVFEFVERTGQMAKTAAKSPDDYYDFFKPLLEEYDSIVHFAASSGISSIAENARIAGERLGGNRVHVVDTLNLSSAIAILARGAIEMIKEGKLTAGEIAELCRERRKYTHGSFLIEDLSYLYKGGRCSSLTYYAANLLKIKPVVALALDGRMVVREKLLGSRERVIERYFKHQLEMYPPNLDYCYINVTSRSDKLESFLRDVLIRNGYHFKEVNFNSGSCNCVVHSGRNTVGIFFTSNKAKQ